MSAKMPWKVIDTATDEPGTGCWFEDTARSLASRLSLGWWPGRYVAVRVVQETPGKGVPNEIESGHG